MKAGSEIYDFYVDKHEANVILDKLNASAPIDDEITIGTFPNGCVLAAICVRAEL